MKFQFISHRHFVSAACLAILCANPAQATSESEELLEILKTKGVLTEQEYQSLKQRAKDKNEAVMSFKDGFKVSTRDERHSLQVGGRVQADYRSFSGPDAQNSDTFDVRRAYLQVGGKFYEKWSYLIAGNFAGSSASLVYAYLNADFHKLANFQVGQFKMPMGVEELTSSRFTNFQERSLAMQLVPAIDRGLMFHGELAPGLHYALAASNGSGANTTESDKRQDDKDITGRLVLNLAETLGTKNAIYHFGASYSQGDISSEKSSLSVGTEAKGVKFFSTEDFTGGKVDRDRYGLETILAYGPAKFQGEYVKNNFSGRTTEDVKFDRDLDSYYLAFNWLLTGENYADSYKHSKFDRLRPKQNFDVNDGWGAWEIGLRYSRLDASDFTAGNLPGTGVLKPGTTNEADAWTLGLKWIVNPNTRALLNYVETDFAHPVSHSGGSSDKERAVTMRLQLDF